MPMLLADLSPNEQACPWRWLRCGRWVRAAVAHRRDPLRVYLDYRAARWPATANPHLFIQYRRANHLGPVQIEWLAHRLGLSTQALREDRIVHEVHANGGEVRRLCGLFGLSISGAELYATVLDVSDPGEPKTHP
ncbi:hypothetical protein AB0F52_39215 [Amycolatopsis sp. NPDC024027]|uniref:hypothetical protein n=1 Tax=Amycolatopsis sp. NPDC024027 TaxID=3154327 RepID=UPI00340AE4F1